MWLAPPDLPVPDDLARVVGGHPLVARALVQRGYGDVSAARAFLDPDKYTPAEPGELPSLAEAASRLEAALQAGERILVWGDFDVDGQTATAVLVSALGELGARVDYHVPVRSRESHGVSLPVLLSYLEGEQPPAVLLTCDTGIAAHEAVDYAQGRGVEAIITDHHALPPALPSARYIVTPRLVPESHPLSTLPGVGVAYKLAEELYRRAGRAEESAQFHDLVALGIVADVAMHRGETRYLLQRGLALLRRSPRPGLQAIYERAELDPVWLTEEHIGFVIAPRLNALGRLGDANPAVALLTTRDLGQARLLALQLEGLNARRQLLTRQVLRGALAQIEQERSLLDHSALVLAGAGWEAGVIGIVAGHLAERFARPAVLIALPSPPSPGRGSARSVEGVDITAALSAVAAGPDSPLRGFGGHAMAAGFSIDPNRIDDFRRRLSRAIELQRPQRGAAQAQEGGTALAIDGYLELSELTLELVADLERLAPFGPGNPPLVLASRGLRLVSHAQVGRDGEHLLLTVEDQLGVAQRVMWWGGAETLDMAPLPEGPFDLAYTARSSTYQGQRGMQLEWLGFRQEQEVISLPRPAIAILDYRQEADLRTALLRWMASAADSTVQVWAEGPNLPKGGGLEAVLRGRDELAPCEALAIWTTPPSGPELRQALERSRPSQVALFAIDPSLDSSEAYLTRLAGLVKYALGRGGGQASLPRLAAAMASREAAVRLGLEWLAARGFLRIAMIEETGIVLSSGGEPDPARLAQLSADLEALLQETRSYRKYFGRAESSALIAG